MKTENISQTAPQSNEKEKKSKKKLIAILILLLLLLIGLATCSIGSLRLGDEQSSAAAIMPELDGNAEDIASREDLEAAMQGQADASYFSLQINPDVMLSASSKQGTFEVVNPATNVYPISVDLYLKDGTLLYSSGGIMPNKQIKTISIEENLAPGTYEAYANVLIYNDSNHAKEGETQAVLTITVTE